jgi:hypothetical protein
MRVNPSDKEPAVKRCKSDVLLLDRRRPKTGTSGETRKKAFQTTDCGPATVQPLASAVVTLQGLPGEADPAQGHVYGDRNQDEKENFTLNTSYPAAPRRARSVT